MIKRQLNRFIISLQIDEFYQAHEDLELVWFARRFEDSDEVRFLKGLINGSVSLELLKQSKVVQSQKVWQTYLKYLPLLGAFDSLHKELYEMASSVLEAKKEQMEGL